MSTFSLLSRRTLTLHLGLIGQSGLLFLIERPMRAAWPPSPNDSISPKTVLTSASILKKAG